MTHFSVMVVTDNKATKELEQALEPYHQFECTGYVDQYVQSVDVTQECREDYRRYREKDSSFLEYVEADLELPKISPRETPNLEGEHKWGWIEVDENEKILRVIRRTNPNEKWDWWRIGGRFSDRLLTYQGQRCNSARKKDVDFATMRQQARDRARKEWLEFDSLFGQDKSSFVSWEACCQEYQEDLDRAREVYNSQSLIVTIEKNENFWFADAEKFLAPIEEYVAKTENNAVTFFAMVLDSEWHEKGKVGWFATIANEKKDWQAEFFNLLDSVGEDRYLTIVDCHI